MALRGRDVYSLLSCGFILHKKSIKSRKQPLFSDSSFSRWPFGGKRWVIRSSNELKRVPTHSLFFATLSSACCYVSFDANGLYFARVVLCSNQETWYLICDFDAPWSAEPFFQLEKPSVVHAVAPPAWEGPYTRQQKQYARLVTRKNSIQAYLLYH